MSPVDSRGLKFLARFSDKKSGGLRNRNGSPIAGSGCKNIPFFTSPEKGGPWGNSTSSARPGAEKKESDPQQTLNQVSGLIQEHIGVTDFRLNFSIGQDTKTVVVKVIDAKTGKIIREIPPSELLALAKSMKELEGFLFNENI